jgi:hypothetical protein
VLGNEPRHASGLRTSDTGQPLETYHPETTHLTATCSSEDCSAFTRVAARTLARSPIRDQLHRKLQHFSHLHDCSGCFGLERLPGAACTHWEAPSCHGAHVKGTLWIEAAHVAPGRRGTVGRTLGIGGVRAYKARQGKVWCLPFCGLGGATSRRTSLVGDLPLTVAKRESREKRRVRGEPVG